jgi:hypothetical protein
MARSLSADAIPLAAHDPVLARMVTSGLGLDPAGILIARDGDPAGGRALARTIGDRIEVTSQFEDLSPAVRWLVLAHECAHVAQKRLAPRGLSLPRAHEPAYRDAIEQEASAAAVSLLAGRPFRCRLMDEPGIPAHWGPSGHYYTSLYVMLASGIAIEKALRRAFFCQMLDQVYEFDAIAAFVDWTDFDIPSSLPILGKPATHPDDVLTEIRKTLVSDGLGKAWIPEVHETLASVARRRAIDWQISTGLHCLTGRDGATEVTIRTNALKSFPDDDIRFGIALHPFGDSFSHQHITKNQTYVPGKMYSPMHGHGLDGHDPDDPLSHPGNYKEYVLRLFDVCQEVVGQTSRYKSGEDLFAALAAIPGVGKENDDAKRNQMMSAAIVDLIRKQGLAELPEAGRYKPEFEPMRYWRAFSSTHSGKLNPEGADRILRIVRQLGEAWSIARN